MARHHLDLALIDAGILAARGLYVETLDAIFAAASTPEAKDPANREVQRRVKTLARQSRRVLSCVRKAEEELTSGRTKEAYRHVARAEEVRRAMDAQRITVHYAGPKAEGTMDVSRSVRHYLAELVRATRKRTEMREQLGAQPGLIKPKLARRPKGRR